VEETWNLQISVLKNLPKITPLEATKKLDFDQKKRFKTLVKLISAGNARL
jgi:hypothetical protein